MIKRFLAALQFLTRLPAWPPIKVETKDFARSMAFFPLVGLLIGLLLAGTARVGLAFFIPEAAAVLIITAEIVLTGALHLDGFMDTMDGLFCGRSRERRLEILRDSRVGAHSVVAVTILLLLKWALLLQLAVGEEGRMLGVLLLMPAVGRTNMVLCTYGFPYVRKQGLGKAFAGALRPVDVAIALAALVLPLGLLFDVQGLLAGGMVAGIALLAAAAAARLLGGLTGDVYGWINELSEVIWLMIILAI